jgi:hypothetical protein
MVMTSSLFENCAIISLSGEVYSSFRYFSTFFSKTANGMRQGSIDRWKQHKDSLPSTETTQGALPSAAPPIGGAVAAVGAVPCGFRGVIARVVGVTVPDSHVTAISDSYAVIATPEIR